MTICGGTGYLETAYLSAFSYLSGQPEDCTGIQAEMFTETTNLLGTQSQMKIDNAGDDEFLGTQAEMKVFAEDEIGVQSDMVKTEIVGAQATLAIYNNTQLRILCSFDSRGTPALGGATWTSVQPIEAGDFDPDNLNTDVLEQRTQTDSVTALWELRCNTGKTNTFVDTVGILEHNFSAAATVQMQGSDDAAFSVIKFTENLTVEPENMYFIAAQLPTTPAQYYRFTIQDPTNADGFLRVGTIVFGSSLIFTRKECFINPVKFGQTHFKDGLETEGFTNVSNDRATRKFLSLTFDELNFSGGNFELLRDYFSDAKTDLKCLIIPRPTRASSLAVFAKLVRLPDELHNAIDDDNHFVELTLDWDESL